MQSKSTLPSHEIEAVSINDDDLTIQQVIAVTRHFAKVEPFAGPKRAKTQRVREYIEKNWFSDSAEARYGFNTGIGSLKSVRIPQEDIREFQKRYIKSHCVGVGKPLDIATVRGAMLLQANSLSRGFSGIRAIIVDKLLEMLNLGVHPVVPEQGSLGASGDLAPLTHIASALVGEDEAQLWVSGERVSIKSLKSTDGQIEFIDKGKQITFTPIELEGKEAISLTNATAMMLSMAVHLLYDAEVLLKNADISAALSLEAMMCEKDAFAEELHALRHQNGQINTAGNISVLIADSQRMSKAARAAYFDFAAAADIKNKTQAGGREIDIPAVLAFQKKYEFHENRVQDSYSLRCVPQVHGASKDAFTYVKNIINREMLAVTDNPVIFETDAGEFVSKSGGNFHGQPLAVALDFLAIALAEIGSISDRRMFRLLSPRMSFGLPNNLTGGEIGLNSGLMMVQYTAAQLVSENKVLAHPASVDSIPTSDNQEDHVSMGWTAARKARQILKNVQHIIGMEYLSASQGIHLSARDESVSLQRFRLGKGTNTAFATIAEHETATGDRLFLRMDVDRYLHRLITAMEKLSTDGHIVDAVENVCTLRI